MTRGSRIRKKIIGIMLGGCLLQTATCATSIRETLVIGFEGITQALADTLIGELFGRLEPDDEGISATNDGSDG